MSCSLRWRLMFLSLSSSQPAVLWSLTTWGDGCICSFRWCFAQKRWNVYWHKFRFYTALNLTGRSWPFLTLCRITKFAVTKTECSCTVFGVVCSPLTWWSNHFSPHNVLVQAVLMKADSKASTIMISVADNSTFDNKVLCHSSASCVWFSISSRNFACLFLWGQGFAQWWVL